MDKVKIKQRRESDFKEIEYEFDFEHVELAEKLAKLAATKYGAVYPVMVRGVEGDNGEKLMFGINLAETRTEREMGEKLYRIIIEKVK